MKKLFLFALLTIGLTSFAQEREGGPLKDKMEKLTPEQKTERHLKKLTSELNLNSKQQEQIKPLLLHKAQREKNLRQKEKSTKTAP
ncbi:MAG: hypothetical protein IPO23_02645 [Flavobacterium sp.]|nr:hypothetical protein [Flavobacterium sp.]